MESGQGGGGRGGGGGGGRAGARKGGAAAAAVPGWKKPSGANLSAKAKKEYLKWKREQKRNQTDDTNSDWELGKGGGDAGGGENGGAAAQQQGTAPAAAPRAHRGGGTRDQAQSAVQVAAGARRQERSMQQEPEGPPASRAVYCSRKQPSAPQQQRTTPSEGDDGEEEEATQPPQPQGGAPHAQHGPGPAQQHGGDGGRSKVRATPDSRPLHYVPLVELPPDDVPLIVRNACGVDRMRLPRVREDEVGFTQEGRGLGMPKRPAWRGVVRNAEQLHRLEERSFQAWMDRLYASVDSPSRVSFFEPKLDFWRQLWRVLERSDVAVMIVDARNPLLHFSEALAHHVLDEHGISALLVLNKCDLVPAAAVAEWRRWFEGRYPGLKVVASCAASSGGGGVGAAEAITDAVLGCEVTRDGRRVKVSEVVRMSRDELLAASKARNTHSKRDRLPQQLSKEQQQQQQEPEDEEGATGAEPGSVHGGCSGADGDEDWVLQGNKARKKLAVRKKRNQRMQGGAAAPAATTAGQAAPSEGRSRRSGGDAAGGRRRGGGAQAAQRADEDAVESGAEGEEEETGSEVGTAAGATTEATTEAELDAEEEEQEEDSECDNDNAAFEDMGIEEDREGFLGGGDEGDSDEHGGQDEDGDEEGKRKDARAVPGAVRATGWGGHGARGGRDRRGRSRPVVVCVVGEPNVGKSSTMNALLGAKRVAVSSHPGRTKHYQTHVMCPSLMLCDCPGLVFPRLDVSLHMQVLFGSYPIARCRDPYAVVRYLAERVWPRLHVTLGLKPVMEDEEEEGAGSHYKGGGGVSKGRPAAAEWRDEDWTPLALCQALAARHSWRSRRGGRLDEYRAANWILRSALAGRNGVDVAFLPPDTSEKAGTQAQACVASRV